MGEGCKSLSDSESIPPGARPNSPARAVRVGGAAGTPEAALALETSPQRSPAGVQPQLCSVPGARGCLPPSLAPSAHRAAAGPVCSDPPPPTPPSFSGSLGSCPFRRRWPPLALEEAREWGERGSCQGPCPASDRKAAAHGTGSDFTGKMKGNCIFNNSPRRFGGRQVGGRGATGRSQPVFLEARWLRSLPERLASISSSPGQWEPLESRPG